FVTGRGKPIIQDNQFLSNAASGIFCVRHAKGEIRRNLCQNTGYGIAISDQAAPLVSENRLVSNRVGLHLSRQSRPVLRRNLIEENTQGGIVITGEAKPEFGHPQDPAGNIVRNNSEFDLRNSSLFALVSAGNLLNPANVEGVVEFVSTEIEVLTTGPSEFKDISGHWAEVFISALVERGLISGFPDGTFKPEANLTRAEYAAIIAKTFDLPRQLGANTAGFSDVPSDFWGFAAIQKAAAMKFIAGFPNGTFRPQNKLTRVQALVSLVSGLGLSGGNVNVLSVYSDRAQIPSYATNAIATATERRMVVNYPQPHTLDPMRDITRAEIAALVYQALVATNQAKAIASPYIVNADSYLPSFADIQDHWASDFIRRLASLDLINGFMDGTFKPNDPINRAQYAALIVKVFHPPFLRPPTQFTDIPADFWALSVIQHAYRSGYLSGFPDQTFHPEQNLRRIHLIVSLANGLGLPSAPESLLGIYDDSNTIPAYAQAAVASATQAGIIVNASILEQLKPMAEATRADAAAMVYQALVFQQKAIAIDSPYIIRV
ncbi:MAG: S-layer homology domain-containing protein, partial [Chroococcales cyanobacterium]